jgi:uncharacterized repeat protein (TIGR01451 family)
VLIAESNILDVDSNGNGTADIGDIIAYTVHITNIGNTAATNPAYHDIVDNNTSIIANSLQNPTGTITTTTNIIDARQCRYSLLKMTLP